MGSAKKLAVYSVLALFTIYSSDSSPVGNSLSSLHRRKREVPQAISDAIENDVKTWSTDHFKEDHILTQEVDSGHTQYKNADGKVVFKETHSSVDKEVAVLGHDENDRMKEGEEDVYVVLRKHTEASKYYVFLSYLRQGGTSVLEYDDWKDRSSNDFGKTDMSLRNDKTMHVTFDDVSFDVENLGKLDLFTKLACSIGLCPRKDPDCAAAGGGGKPGDGDGAPQGRAVAIEEGTTEAPPPAPAGRAITDGGGDSNSVGGGKVPGTKARTIANAKAGKDGNALATAVSKGEKGSIANAVNGKLAKATAVAEKGGDSLANSKTEGDEGAVSSSMSKGTGVSMALSNSTGKGKAKSDSIANEGASNAQALSSAGGGSDSNALGSGKGSSTSNAWAAQGGQSKSTAVAQGEGNANGTATAVGGGGSKSATLTAKGGNSMSNANANAGGASHSSAIADKGGFARSAAISHGGDAYSEALSEQGKQGAEANAFTDDEGKSDNFADKELMDKDMQDISALAKGMGSNVDRSIKFDVKRRRRDLPKAGVIKAGETAAQARAGKDGNAIASAVSKGGDKNAMANAIDGKLAQAMAISENKGSTLANAKTAGEKGALAKSLSKGTGIAKSSADSQGVGRARADAIAKGNDSYADALSMKGGGSEANAQSDQTGTATSNGTALEGGNSKATSLADGTGDAKSTGLALGGGSSKALSITAKGGKTNATANANEGGATKASAISEQGGAANSDAVSRGGDAYSEATSVKGDGGATANAYGDGENKQADFATAQLMGESIKQSDDASDAISALDKDLDFSSRRKRAADPPPGVEKFCHGFHFEDAFKLSSRRKRDTNIENSHNSTCVGANCCTVCQTLDGKNYERGRHPYTRIKVKVHESRKDFTRVMRNRTTNGNPEDVEDSTRKRSRKDYEVVHEIPGGHFGKGMGGSKDCKGDCKDSAGMSKAVKDILLKLAHDMPEDENCTTTEAPAGAGRGLEVVTEAATAAKVTDGGYGGEGEHKATTEAPAGAGRTLEVVAETTTMPSAKVEESGYGGDAHVHTTTTEAPAVGRAVEVVTEAPTKVEDAGYGGGAHPATTEAAAAGRAVEVVTEAPEGTTTVASAEGSTTVASTAEGTTTVAPEGTTSEAPTTTEAAAAGRAVEVVTEAPAKVEEAGYGGGGGPTTTEAPAVGRAVEVVTEAPAAAAKIDAAVVAATRRTNCYLGHVGLDVSDIISESLGDMSYAEILKNMPFYVFTSVNKYRLSRPNPNAMTPMYNDLLENNGNPSNYPAGASKSWPLVGRGPCCDTSKNVAEGPEFIKKMLRMLGLQCDESTSKQINGWVGDGSLVVNGEVVEISPTFSLLTKKRLTEAEARILASLTLISGFTKAMVMDATLSAEPAKTPMGEMMSRSIRFIVIMTLKAAHITTQKANIHLVKMTQAHISVLRAVMVGLLNDKIALDGTTRDGCKMMNEVNRRVITALIEFLRCGMDGFKAESDTCDIFWAFYMKYHKSITKAGYCMLPTDCRKWGLPPASVSYNDQPLPVMVYIHGGGFVRTASNAFGPDRFMALQDVILVTFNYRLGVFGFMTTTDENIPPNLGLYDQILALKWVKKYIIEFGGDPQKITVFGNSVGAVSLHYLLLSPLATGLMNRAILQSGCAFCDRSLVLNPLDTIRNVSKVLNCPTLPNEAMVKCLYSHSTEELIEAQAVITEHWQLRTKFGPVIDGYVIPGDPVHLPILTQVPLLVGMNRDEGLLSYVHLTDSFSTDQLFSVTSIEHDVLPYLFNLIVRNPKTADVKDLASKVVLYYNRFQVDPIAAVIEVLGDIWTNACMRRFLEQLSFSYYSRPVYVYLLTHRDRDTPSLTDKSTDRFDNEEIHNPVLDFGVSHGDEQLYLFRFDSNRIPPFNNTRDELMATAMTNIWSSFADIGSPALDSNSVTVNWPYWQPLSADPTNIPFYNLNLDYPGNNYNFRTCEASFWKAIHTIPSVN